ncbi:MAG: NADH-quinone oxidoreductase subunit J [Verrucomicrobia bacterium]|nr:NADH-quinone oxidoreductase subunit J [Verrucomicrobiota bacterium]
MDPVFCILALVTAASAIAAVSLRRLVHCALCLVVTFVGLAALYLQLNAQFVGFAQILVYVGAVAILIVFAILLTRGSDSPPQSIFSSSWVVGVGVAVLAFGALAFSVWTSSVIYRPAPPAPQPTVRELGEQLMTQYVLPLEVIGLLLTAALIGAVIIAMREGPARHKSESIAHRPLPIPHPK